MAIEVKLPELGENIAGARVLNILVREGDAVGAEQGLIEVETDKAAIEIPSPLAGHVVSILVKEGDEVEIGQVIAAIEAAPDRVEATLQAASGQFGGPEADGDRAVAQHRTSGAGSPPESTPAAPDRRMEESTRQASPKAGSQPGGRVAADVHAAPSLRRVARELGIDITQVRGSGPQGRVRPDDLRPGGREATGAERPALPDFSKWGEVEIKAMPGIRRATAAHLAQAWSQIPHVTQHDQADITELEDARQRFQGRAEAAGAKLTITALAIKALAAALQVHPQFNSSIDPAAEQVIHKKYVHIGVAVDTPGGLLVPVIRNPDRKGLVEIAAELAELSRRARERKLSLDEMRGATCTLTNLGGLGTTYFTPIVNWPEVAIVGIGRARREPVWSGADFQPRLIMPLSVSYDHRAADGADAARFLRWFAEALEAPLLMLL